MKNKKELTPDDDAISGLLDWIVNIHDLDAFSLFLAYYHEKPIWKKIETDGIIKIPEYVQDRHFFTKELFEKYGNDINLKTFPAPDSTNLMMWAVKKKYWYVVNFLVNKELFSDQYESVFEKAAVAAAADTVNLLFV